MNPLLRSILIRLAQSVPMLIAISVLVFVSSHLAPGDPITNALTGQMPQSSIDAIRHAYGLDRPLPEQYFFWLSNLLQGHWGESIVYKVSVISVLWPAFLNTVVLMLAAVLICVVFGVTLGVFSGLHQGRRRDTVSMLVIQLGHNLPVFWLGLLLMWVFALRLHWLPSSGMTDMRGDGGVLDVLRHLVLPAFSAALISMLILARLVRSSTIDVMKADYIRTYRSLGIPSKQLLLRHLGRNLLSPIINITGLQIGYLLSGVILVENVFAWPGIGTQLYQAAAGRDYPMAQAGVMLVAASFIGINLLTDIFLDLLNPRLRG